MPASADGFSPRIVDSLVDALVVIEDRGRVLYANPALGRLLGHEVGGLFGRAFADFLPEKLRSPYSEVFLEWMKMEPPPRSPGPTRIALLSADGSEIPVDVATFLVAPERGPRLVIAALWDAGLRIDVDRFRQVADELMAFLAEASGDIEHAVSQFLGVIAGSLDFDAAVAWRWDEEQELLFCEHAWSADSSCRGLLKASIGLTARAGEGLAGLVADSNKPRWFGDLANSPQLRRHRAIVEDGLTSAFSFPVRTHDHLVGVVELFGRTKARPDTALFDAVAEIGAQLGTFIERLELEDDRNTLLVELESARAELAFLLQANVALVEARNFEEAVHRLGEIAVPTLGDICLIDVVGADGQLERVVARHSDPGLQPLADGLLGLPPDLAGTHPAALAVRTQKPQWSVDMGMEFMTTTTQGRDHLALTQSLGFRSFVSVPLIAGDESIGALTVITTDEGRSFGDRELHLAESLARQVARAVERARSFDEQSTLARNLQTSMLPTVPTHLGGVEVAVRYDASTRGAQVGGDFYDVVPLGNDHVALTIGDVEGHDVTAATVMGQLRSAIRAYLFIADDPGIVLGLANRFLMGQEGGRFATAVIAVLDTTSGEITLASAGHPPPVVQRPNQSLSSMDLTPGPPLGVGTDAEPYPVTKAELSSSDVLAFYTDGLIDVGHSSSSVRMERLAQALAASGSHSSDEIAEAIMFSLTEVDQRIDDGALLVMKFTQRAPGVSRDRR
jgi:PAS domain S-box-containing protein